MNKPLCKNIQNIDGNKIVKAGVCKFYWSRYFWLNAGEKSHFEKTPLKICILTEFYRCKDIKCNKRNT